MSDEILLSHLDAAYNLARWLTGNDADAADVVQDACVRALSAEDRFRGGDRRAWLLAIVRNGCYSLHRRQRVREATGFDEEQHSGENASASPERLAIDRERSHRVRRAVEALPAEFREVLVLREFEGLSYKEIAGVVSSPIGTVMSRLSRARAQLAEALAADLGGNR